MSRKRLPKGEVMVFLDEKLVNMLRYYQLLDDESAKPQKKVIYLTSMMAEMSEVSELMVERLQWLFNDQYPRSKYIWGAIKTGSNLPDKMPKNLQRAVKRYKERNGL